MSECLLVDGPRLIVTPGGEKALMAALDKSTGATVGPANRFPANMPRTVAPLLFRHGGRRIRGQLFFATRLRRRCRQRKAAVDGAAAEPLRSERGHAGLRRGRIFYTTPYVYGTCYQLRPADAGPQPAEAWNTTLDTCTGTLLLVDGRLYGSGYRKHKSWLCLDWESGRNRYEFKALTTGAAVYAEGRLYCLAEDGRVALLKPTADTFEIAGQFRLIEEKVHDAWAHPVLLHGRLVSAVP